MTERATEKLLPSADEARKDNKMGGKIAPVCQKRKHRRQCRETTKHAAIMIKGRASQ